MQDLEEGLEFHASYLNEHGTGHITIVSNCESGMVDLTIQQVVAHEHDESALVSLVLPPEAAGAIIRALSAGIAVTTQARKLKKYN